MFADDIATVINKPADFGKKGGHGDTRGRLQSRNISTVLCLACRGNTRPIKALSVSDGILPLMVRDPPAHAEGFYCDGVLHPIQARSASKGITGRMNCLRTA